MRTRKIQQNEIKFVQPCEEKSFSVFFFNCIWFVFSVSVCNFIAYFRKSKKNFWFKTLAVAIFGYKYCGKFYYFAILLQSILFFIDPHLFMEASMNASIYYINFAAVLKFQFSLINCRKIGSQKNCKEA